MPIMKAINSLLAKYPKAQIVETKVAINQEDYDVQVAKNRKRQAEGGAIGAVFMENDSVILVHRQGMHTGWALPGGTVERGEDFSEAFLREIEEETSVIAHITGLILVERRIFISPKDEHHAMDLVFFEASAKPNQIATTTELAKTEGLAVSVFRLNNLPDMIFKDRERLLNIKLPE